MGDKGLKIAAEIAVNTVNILKLPTIRYIVSAYS